MSYRNDYENRREQTSIEYERFRQNRILAIRLLTHYMRMAWENAGLTWTIDNSAEIATLVHALMND